MDLILRPHGPYKFSLELRNHGPAETEYYEIAKVSDEMARNIIEAGAPRWHLGKPDWNKRFNEMMLAEADKMSEEADKIREKYKSR